MAKRPKIVLYSPQQVNQSLGQFTSYDITPMEMVQIAAIPDEVWRVWKLYYQYASFVHGLVRPKRGLVERISEWRLRSGNYRFPIELKAFYLMDKAFGWRARKEDRKRTWIMAQENESVAMVS